MTYRLIDNGNGFELHRSGCPDIPKKERVHGAGIDVEGVTADDAVGCVLDTFMYRQAGWDESHFTIYGCAR